MIRRLVNIELAHLDLLGQARDADVSWALIIEDDAQGDPGQVASILGKIIRQTREVEQPKYVNFSHSFSEKKLRIKQQLQEIDQISTPSSTVTFFSSRLPVTNTVCAVLYRGAFLHLLLQTMDDIPLDPVVPIDWKLNKALMRINETSAWKVGDCWTLSPAPIIQGSMHPTR